MSKFKLSDLCEWHERCRKGVEKSNSFVLKIKYTSRALDLFSTQNVFNCANKQTQFHNIYKVNVQWQGTYRFVIEILKLYTRCIFCVNWIEGNFWNQHAMEDMVVCNIFIKLTINEHPYKIMLGQGKVKALNISHGNNEFYLKKSIF